MTGTPGVNQITVSAPASTGEGIAGYTVTANPGGAQCTTPNATITTCTISGLTPGTAYTFTVVARGVNGNHSAPSMASQAVAAGPPNPPTGRRAQLDRRLVDGAGQRRCGHRQLHGDRQPG
jgi:chitodextrinase